MRPAGDDNDFDADSAYVVNVPLGRLIGIYRSADELYDPDMLDRMANDICMRKAGWRPVWTWWGPRKR